MLRNLRGKGAALTAVALVAGVLAFGGGTAVGKARYDANNAHKVDGKHAVAATASNNARKRKLVATGANGRLPNNIIRKAPDANKLDGRNSTSFESRGGFAYRTRTTASTTGSMTWSDLPGSSMVINTPRPAVLVVDFAAESYCVGGSYCSVRILVDGAEAAPAVGYDFAFDTTSTDQWESNAMTRIIPVTRGAHTVEVQYAAGAGGGSFRLDDWTLVAQGHVD